MNRIQLAGEPGAMACHLVSVPAFPGERFTLGYPEAIGDVARPEWFSSIKPRWSSGDHGVWISRGEQPGELSYTLTFTPEEDVVTCALEVTNLSERTWSAGMAFNCFQCGAAPSVRDHSCIRHWVRMEERFRPLWELPRVFGPRPALQLYSVEGAPAGADLPFVAGFHATPDVVVEPWMAIVARDGRRLVATVSMPGLFLFQNREYSCIHSATGFGEVRPGQTARAVNRTYFVEARLEDWHARMTRDLAAL